MTITAQTVQQLDETAFLVRFTSNAPLPVPIRIYVDGALASSWDSPTPSGQWLAYVEPGSDPLIEILDRPLQRPKVAFPGNVVLAWDASPGAASYRVEEQVDAVWVLRATIAETGFATYLYRTRWLADGLPYPFRVVATDGAGNDSAVSTRTVNQVRQPPVPRVTYTYSAGTGKITVASV